MTSLELMDFLWDWCDDILDNDVVPLIYGNQNAPRPDPPYIVIGVPFARRKIGRPGVQEAYERTEIIPPVPPATEPTERVYVSQKGVFDYQATVSFREVGAIDSSTGELLAGDGRYLTRLQESIELSTVRDKFAAAGVSYMREESIQELPEVREGSWEPVAATDIIFGFASSFEEETGAIEAVEITKEES